MIEKLAKVLTGFGIAFLSFVFGSIASVVYVQLYNLEYSSLPTVALFLLASLSLLVSLLVLLIGLKVTHKTKWLQLKKPRPFIATFVLASIVYGILLFLSMALLGYFLGEEVVNQSQELGFAFEDLSTLDLVLTGVLLIVLVPTVEEFLYRGVLFSSLRGVLPNWLAAVIVSGFFAFAHGQVNVGVDTFILSMVGCYLVIKTNSLLPAVLLHAAKNAIAFVLLVSL